MHQCVCICLGVVSSMYFYDIKHIFATLWLMVCTANVTTFTHYRLVLFWLTIIKSTIILVG